MSVFSRLRLMILFVAATMTMIAVPRVSYAQPGGLANIAKAKAIGTLTDGAMKELDKQFKDMVANEPVSEAAKANIVKKLNEMSRPIVKKLVDGAASGKLPSPAELAQSVLKEVAPRVPELVAAFKTESGGGAAVAQKPAAAQQTAPVQEPVPAKAAKQVKEAAPAPQVKEAAQGQEAAAVEKAPPAHEAAPVKTAQAASNAAGWGEAENETAAPAKPAEAAEAAKSAEAAVSEVAATVIKGSDVAVLNKAVLGNVASKDTASKDTADGIAEDADTAEAKIAKMVAEATAEAAKAAKAAAAKAAEEVRAFKAAADAALMREKEAQINADNAMSAARAAKANEEAMAALQATMNTRAAYFGYGGIALGCGTIIYGIIQNSSATSHIDKRQFRQAEKTAKSRDAAYYFGAAALLSGITVIILF